MSGNERYFFVPGIAASGTRFSHSSHQSSAVQLQPVASSIFGTTRFPQWTHDITSKEKIVEGACKVLFPSGRGIRSLSDLLLDDGAGDFLKFVRNWCGIETSRDKPSNAILEETAVLEVIKEQQDTCRQCSAIKELLGIAEDIALEDYEETYGRSLEEFQSDGLSLEQTDTKSWRRAKASCWVGNGWRKYWSTQRNREELATHLCQLIALAAHDASFCGADTGSIQRGVPALIHTVLPSWVPSGVNIDPFSPLSKNGGSISRLWLPALGPEGSSFVEDVNLRLMRGVETGDFISLGEIGNEIINSGIAYDYILAGAIYIKAESLRLQADCVTDPSEKNRLRRESEQLYQQSLEMRPDSIKTKRGLGRLYESLSDPDNAKRELSSAYQNVQSMSLKEQARTNEVMHEGLRAGRHWLTYQLNDIAASLWGGYTEHEKRVVIEAQLIWAEKLHRRVLPALEVTEKWHGIERFMAYTQLGYVAGAIGDEYRGVKYLLSALKSRCEMEDFNGDSASSVVLANMRWWKHNVKASIKRSPGILEGIELLDQALEVRTLLPIRESCDNLHSSMNFLDF